MQGAVTLPERGSTVDWSKRMGNGERALEHMRRELNRLHGDDEDTAVRRTVVMNRLREYTCGMHSFMEDCLCGRNDFEQAMMRYKVRMEFPLYSHMDAVFALVPASEV
jgi:hypothetical protein